MKIEKILVLFCVFMLCASVCDVLPIHGEEKIYGSVVRLHVLANSDLEEDQALKLKVRDAVLSYVSPRQLLLILPSAILEESLLASVSVPLYKTVRPCQSLLA